MDVLIQHNYTTSFTGALNEAINIAQVTLNYMHSVQRRQTSVHNLCKNRRQFFIIHWDYINVPTKWNLFSSTKKERILKELSYYASLQKEYPQFLGIVMHTNNAIDTKVLKSKETFSEHYNVSTYSPEEFWLNYDGLFGNQESLLHKFQLDSMSQFCSDLTNANIAPIIYFENNTRSKYNIFTYDFLCDWIKDKPSNLGICYDTEHEYAQTGKEFDDIEEAIEGAINTLHPLMVHYNVIPEGIYPYSLKDAHSLNTIAECSYATAAKHLLNIRLLSLRGIPFVREIKEETMYREEEYLRSIVVTPNA